MHEEPSTYVVSLTPFAEDGAVDEAGLRGHLARLVAAGIGIYVGGSGSGEGYTLRPEEVARVFAVSREAVPEGSVPLLAMGVEPRSAAEMIELSRQVEGAGLDGMQIYSLDVGHGNRPRPDELEAYLRDVLDAVCCPVVLSSHQAMGYALPPALVDGLIVDYPHIRGIHFTNPDVTELVRMLDVTRERIPLHVGGPMQALTVLALGGQGYLSSEGNLAPRLCVSVIEHHRRGALAERDAAFRKLLVLFSATQRLGSVAAEKGALRELGLPGGWPRRPRLPVHAAAAKELADCFRALGLEALEGL